MTLWHIINEFHKPLRQACRRFSSFCWVQVVLATMCLLPDGMGVAGLMRSGWLKDRCYGALLNLFNGRGVNLKDLTRIWAQIVSKRFEAVRIGGKYTAFVADGVSIPKEGKKMPAVRTIHCASENNSKPEFIMGHFFQVISSLVKFGDKIFAVPIVSRITDGITTTNRDRRTVSDHLMRLYKDKIAPIFEGPRILIADAYYASRKVIVPLLQQGDHLISRVRKNAVAYLSPPGRGENPGRGRPRKFSDKILLREIFSNEELFYEVDSPVYGESSVKIQIYSKNLTWRSSGVMVKFVWIIHPRRGKIILVCTDPELSDEEIIRAYGLRFKIEVSFKVIIRQIHGYAYRFWARCMKPVKRGDKNQHMPTKKPEYREKVFQKINAYHLFVQLACIAQGTLQYLSLYHGSEVWLQFRSWLRTMRPSLAPSEQVVSMALQSTLLSFLSRTGFGCPLQEILTEAVEPERVPGALMAA